MPLHYCSCSWEKKNFLFFHKNERDDSAFEKMLKTLVNTQHRKIQLLNTQHFTTSFFNIREGG